MKRPQFLAMTVTLLSLTILASACGNSPALVPARDTSSSSSPATSPGKSNTAAERFIFHKWVEPREKAFSFYYPQGWQITGGLYYLDPNKVGGAINSTEPKCDLIIQEDSTGAVQMHFLPDYIYCDTRRMPAGQMGLFQPGSNYNGMPVVPMMNARQFLTDFVFPRLRPQAIQIVIVEAKPVPELANYYQKLSFLPGSQSDAAVVTLTYQENGRAYWEQLLGVTYTFGQLGTGMWGSKSVVTARTPLEVQKKYDKQFLFTYSSVRINPQWLLALMKASAQRAGIALDTQRYLQQLDNEIVAHRQQTNAAIQQENYLALTGQEEYINPFTKEVERRPDEFKYHWENPGGEIIVTNNGDYSPNYDPEVKRTDYKRSEVRPR
jgi:hypothetical protein